MCLTPSRYYLQDELFSIAVSDVLVGGIIASAQRKVDPAGTYAQPQKSFFRRSESMTFLGCGESDPFSVSNFSQPF